MGKFYDPIEQRESSLDTKDVTIKKDKEVDLSERLYQDYRGSAEIWRAQAKEDEDFRNGAQWTEAEVKALKSKGHSPIVVNVVHPAVEQAKALLTHNNPRFTATARENSDAKIAHVFADIMQYVWQISNGNLELKEAIDDYYVKGLGAMLAYYDPYADFGKGEVYVKMIDPFDLFIDPNAKSPYIDDAAHVIIAKKMTTEQILRQYPNVKDKLAQAEQNEDDIRPTTNRHGAEDQNVTVMDAYHTSYTVLDRYSRVKVGKYRVSAPDVQYEKILDADEYSKWLQSPVVTETSANGIKYIVDEKEVAAYIDLYQKSGGTYHYVVDPQTGQPTMAFGLPDDNAIPNSEVVLNVLKMHEFVANGIVLVEQILVNRIKRVMSVGGAKIYSGIIPIENYPIVTFMNRHKRDPYPMSDVRFVRDIQEAINKIRSLIIAHASSSTNVKLLLPRGASNKKELEREWGKAGTGVIEFDPEIGTPIVAGPVPLPNELYKLESDHRHDIQEILGVYSLGAGDASQAHDSFRGTMAIDEFAQRRIKSKRDDIEGGINRLAKVVIDLVQKVWTVPKTIRIVQPNDKPKEIFLNKPLYTDYGNVIGKINDITVGKYDVITVSGSTLPSNRWAKLDTLMQLFDRGIIDDIEIIRLTEVADATSVLERKNMLAQAMQQIQSLQKQIKDLEGDAQTKDREISHMQKRVELEKFKARVQGVEGDLRKAQQMFEARSRDQLQLQQKEHQLNQRANVNG